VAGETKREEDVSKKRTLVPSAASVGRRGSQQERNREGAIHFAGKVGVNGGNIEQSSLAREPGVRHIVGVRKGTGRHSLQAITPGPRRQPSHERVSAAAVCIDGKAARHKSHRIVLRRKSAHLC